MSWFVLIPVLLLHCAWFPVCKGTRHPSPNEFARHLEKLSVDGLGTTEMQRFFDSLSFKTFPLDGNHITSDLATRLANKFKERISVARRMKEAIEASYAKPRVVTRRPLCCQVDTKNLVYNPKFRQKVDMTQVCVRISDDASTNSPHHLQDDVVKLMKHYMQQYPTVPWLYFGSEEGMYTNYPMIKVPECGSYDPRYRPWYVETASPKPKDVVLVIDVSGSMQTQDRLYIAKEAAKTVLTSMNPRDRVAVIAFSDVIQRPKGKDLDDCFQSKLAFASPVNVKIFKKFVDNLVAKGSTSYLKAFNSAFDTLDVYHKHNSTRQPVILFMTDGKPDESKDEIIRVVADRSATLPTKAAILTFGMGTGPDIEEGSKILKILATQAGEINSVGKYSPVTDTKKLRSKMATYYKSFTAPSMQAEPMFSIPYVDAQGLGLLTSITLPCFLNGEFIGVTGTDVIMSDILADVTYFNQGQASYVFVADSSGRTMMHPLLPKPSDVNQAPFFVDIRDLEPEGKFSAIVFEGINRGTPGSMKMTSPRFIPYGGSVYQGTTTKEIPSMYYWTPIPGTSFTLGLVLKEHDHYNTMNPLQTPKGFKFSYHRLDLNKPTTPCQYFGQYADKQTSIVKFDPHAFKNPYDYLANVETSETVKSYANYFEGRTNTNTKFKDTIKNTVYATNKAEKIWLQSKTSLSQYVVWRYIGTRDGVFRMIPGAALAKTFDASTRPWYLTAVSNIGKTTVTTPYVDAAGAGLIITAAHTIYKGRGDNLHTTADDVMAVMGADFPLTYFRKLLTDTYPICNSSLQNSCFVMDRSGFLVYHDSFLSSETSNDVNMVHITVKEKLVAQDMIRTNVLLHKQCRDIASIKTVNFYEVNVKNGIEYTATGLGCSVNYNIHPIANTNAYLGIIEKSSCNNLGGCSCSTDREKKPCLREKPSQSCECPCSSELKFHYCQNKYPQSNISMCPVPSARLSGLLGQEIKIPCYNQSIPQCFDAKCSEKTTEETCEGLVGCSWCIKDKNDLSLSKPYCSQISKCFGGTEGMNSPGSSRILKVCTNDNGNDNGDLSKGAIAGITVAIVVLVIAIVVIIVWKRLKKRKQQRKASKRASVVLQPAANFQPSQPNPHPGAAPPTAPVANLYPYPPYNMDYNDPPVEAYLNKACSNQSLGISS